MSIPLRALIVEDSEDDAILMMRMLKKSGYDPTWKRVDTPAALDKALETDRWDIILSDFSLPGFDGHSALKKVREKGLDVPFIIISGILIEEEAVDLLKAGAGDFVKKGHWARFIPAVERELREATERKDKKKAEKELINYRIHLEQMVALRTKELEQANEALRKAKEAADEATHAKSEFLANMSHEIRTPMNGVISAAELAMEEDKLSPAVKKYLSIIHTSAYALLGIINDILDFTKIEAGQLQLESSIFYLDELLEQLRDIFLHKSREKEIDLNFEIMPHTPLLLCGDPLRLRQILINLIGNAIKFTDTGGQILISITPGRSPDSCVCLQFQVKDTGIGIPPEYLPRLFKPFSQADASHTRKFGGTGLGLSITRKLVEMMGGEIHVESTPGQGSVFSFTICLTQPSDAEAELNIERPFKWAKEKTESYREALSGLHILVAEDNPTNQEIISAILQRVGARVTIAPDGEQTLQAVRQKRFDAVLMDVQMPVMDGYEATREIREWERRKGQESGIRNQQLGEEDNPLIPNSQFLIPNQIPIIAMTAHAMKGDKEKCLAVGMDAYVSKPINRDVLFQTLLKTINPIRTVCLGENEENIMPAQGVPDLLPAIDAPAAMKALLMDWPQYRQILMVFLNSNQDTETQLRTFSEREQPDDIQRLAHALKSSAGNIGAFNLQEKALILEKAVQDRQHADMQQVNDVIAELRQTLQILDQVRQMAESEQESRAAACPTTDERELITGLREAIESYDVDTLHRLISLLANQMTSPLIQELKDTLSDYDFDQAQQIIEKLSTAID